MTPCPAVLATQCHNQQRPLALLVLSEWKRVELKMDEKGESKGRENKETDQLYTWKQGNCCL